MAGRIRWVVPTAADVTTLMSSVIQGAASKDPNGAPRTTQCLALAIEAVRAAILNGNRVPVSATANSVPPTGRVHTIVYAVSLLVSSTPNLTFAIKEEFGDQVKDAKEWLKDVLSGKQSVEYPTDPDQTTIPNDGREMSGGDTEIDMSTDGEESTFFEPTVVPALNPATNLRVIAGAGQNELIWVAPRNFPGTWVTYSVYRGTAAGAESATPVATGLIETIFVDSGLSSGQSYYYFVTATNSAGTSGASNEATGTPT